MGFKFQMLMAVTMLAAFSDFLVLAKKDDVNLPKGKKIKPTETTDEPHEDAEEVEDKETKTKVKKAD
jgi:hypothetical protein